MLIGDEVTIGHRAMLHGCTIGSRILIGMSAIVLDGAVIENEVILGAGSLVPPRKTLESGWVYMGRPAKAVRRLTDKELDYFSYTAGRYVQMTRDYLAETP